MKKAKEKFKYAILGFVSGILNGLFGAGGGVVVVPLLEKFGIQSKKHTPPQLLLFYPPVSLVQPSIL